MAMTKLQAVDIVNNCLQFKYRFGRLPDREWRGITNVHREQAFRIVDAALKRITATNKKQMGMCMIDPYMGRIKVTHITKKKVTFAIDYKPTNTKHVSL
jgi:hypothetical protein